MASNGKKPRTRTVDVKGLVTVISGPEKQYPVYRFSNKQFWEKPKHNPFAS